MSPIDVLGNIIRDQDILRQQTQVMYQVASPDLSMDTEENIQLLSWLNGGWLSRQQNKIESRTKDVQQIYLFKLKVLQKSQRRSKHISYNP